VPVPGHERVGWVRVAAHKQGSGTQTPVERLVYRSSQLSRAVRCEEPTDQTKTAAVELSGIPLRLVVLVSELAVLHAYHA